MGSLDWNTLLAAWRRGWPSRRGDAHLPSGSADTAEILAAELRLGLDLSPPLLPQPETLDPKAEERLRLLQAWIDARHGRDELAALCLSGGGMRSATFGLGVLQALAAKGWLGRFQYLSMVSGGSYIGSWLASWITRVDSTAAVQRELGDSSNGKAAATAANPIRQLRAFSNYLSPQGGLSGDMFTLAALYLRNLLLHWLMLLPLLAGLVLLPLLALGAMRCQAGDGPALAAAWASGLALVLAIAYITSDLPPQGDRSSQGGTSRRQNSAQLRLMLGCHLPLLVAAAAAALAAWWSMGSSERIAPGDAAAAGLFVHAIGIAVGVVLRCVRERPQRWSSFGDWWLRALAVCISGTLGGLLLGETVNALRERSAAEPMLQLLYATLAVPGLVALFGLSVALHTGVVRRASDEDDREWWAHASGGWLRMALGWLLLFALVLHLPPVLMAQLQSFWPAGVGGGMLALATALFGYISKNGAPLAAQARGLASAIGVRLLDLGAIATILLVLVAMSLLNVQALLWFDPTLQAQAQHAVAEQGAGAAALPVGPAAQAVVYGHVLLHAGTGAALLLALVLLLLAAGATWLFGTNTFSLHAMYGNRLVRAFLGATRGSTGNDKRKPDPVTGFDRDDSLPLCQLLPRPTPGQPPRLFPVINLAVNVVAATAERKEWRERKAAPFTATPLHCGGADIGYVPTWGYGTHGMSLARAMTISAAAAAPNMGYHSSRPVAFVMSLFNLRLGWWLPNPGSTHRALWRTDEPTPWTLLQETLALTSDSSPFLYLSDGGHFDNTALYEMVRRRCRRIVLVDGTGDPDYRYDDFFRTVRRIRSDLGVHIVVNDAALPKPQGPRHAVFEIRYAAGNPGWLYYLKPLLQPDDPAELRAYAAATAGSRHPFPHQALADQFFDETQFESYRSLGFHVADKMFEARAVDDEDRPLERTPWPKAPTPASKPAAGQPQAAVPVAGLASRLVEGLQALGTTGALASVLAVGGVVGLSNPAAQQQPPATSASASATASVAGIGGPEWRALLAGMHELTAALAQIASELSRLPAGSPHRSHGDSTSVLVLDLRQQLQTLTQQTRDNSASAPALTLQPVLDELRKIHLAIGLTKAQAASAASTDGQADNGLAGRLATVETQLAELLRRVDQLNPRRNVRGAEGETR